MYLSSHLPPASPLSQQAPQPGPETSETVHTRCAVPIPPGACCCHCIAESTIRIFKSTPISSLCESQEKGVAHSSHQHIPSSCPFSPPALDRPAWFDPKSKTRFSTPIFESTKHEGKGTHTSAPNTGTPPRQPASSPVPSLQPVGISRPHCVRQRVPDEGQPHEGNRARVAATRGSSNSPARLA